MKLIQNNKEADTKTIEFSFIELHVIEKALAQYNQSAFSITGNVNHSEAVNDTYSDFVEIYCE